MSLLPQRLDFQPDGDLGPTGPSPNPTGRKKLIHVLMVSSDPSSERKLNLQAEERAIRKLLARTQALNNSVEIVLDVLPACTVEDLSSKLLAMSSTGRGYDIVHFSGHCDSVNHLYSMLLQEVGRRHGLDTRESLERNQNAVSVLYELATRAAREMDHIDIEQCMHEIAPLALNAQAHNVAPTAHTPQSQVALGGGPALGPALGPTPLNGRVGTGLPNVPHINPLQRCKGDPEVDPQFTSQAPTQSMDALQFLRSSSVGRPLLSDSAFSTSLPEPLVASSDDRRSSNPGTGPTIKPGPPRSSRSASPRRRHAKGAKRAAVASKPVKRYPHSIPRVGSCGKPTNKMSKLPKTKSLRGRPATRTDLPQDEEHDPLGKCINFEVLGGLPQLEFDDVDGQDETKRHQGESEPNSVVDHETPRKRLESESELPGETERSTVPETLEVDAEWDSRSSHVCSCEVTCTHHHCTSYILFQILHKPVDTFSRPGSSAIGLLGAANSPRASKRKTLTRSASSPSLVSCQDESNAQRAPQRRRSRSVCSTTRRTFASSVSLETLKLDQIELRRMHKKYTYHHKILEAFHTDRHTKTKKTMLPPIPHHPPNLPGSNNNNFQGDLPERPATTGHSTIQRASSISLHLPGIVHEKHCVHHKKGGDEEGVEAVEIDGLLVRESSTESCTCSIAFQHEHPHSSFLTMSKRELVNAGVGSLAFESEVGGGIDFVSAKDFAALVSAYSPPIKCVVLNACNSHLPAEQLMTHGVPLAICSRGQITDSGALKFSQGFYEALALGNEIERSYAEGLLRLQLHEGTLERKRTGDQIPVVSNNEAGAGHFVDFEPGRMCLLKSEGRRNSASPANIHIVEAENMHMRQMIQQGISILTDKTQQLSEKERLLKQKERELRKLNDEKDRRIRKLEAELQRARLESKSSSAASRKRRPWLPAGARSAKPVNVSTASSSPVNGAQSTDGQRQQKTVANKSTAASRSRRTSTDSAGSQPPLPSSPSNVKFAVAKLGKAKTLNFVPQKDQMPLNENVNVQQQPHQQLSQRAQKKTAFGSTVPRFGGLQQPSRYDREGKPVTLQSPRKNTNPFL